METKIVILPLVAGRDVAEKINGKTFAGVNHLHVEIENAYDASDNINKDEYITAQEVTQEVNVYDLDEFICRLNDEIYPTDQWVAQVHFV